MEVVLTKLSFTKTVILITVLFSVGSNLYAGEDKLSRKIAIGLGPEWNMNSHHNFAGATVLSFDYSLPSVPLALGINASSSYNFSQTVVLEASPFLRWYFPGSKHTGLFVQADAGFTYIMEDTDRYPMFMGGLRMGYRLSLGSLFFIEPFARGGYPFVFGIGLSAGLRF